MLYFVTGHAAKWYLYSIKQIAKAEEVEEMYEDTIAEEDWEVLSKVVLSMKQSELLSLLRKGKNQPVSSQELSSYSALTDMNVRFKKAGISFRIKATGRRTKSNLLMWHERKIRLVRVATSSVK